MKTKLQEAKKAAAAVEVDLKASIAEAAPAGAGDVYAAAAHCADTTGSVLKTHGKCSWSTGVKGQVRGATLPGAVCSSNEYRPTGVVVCKRDQLPSVDCYVAAVPRYPSK